jgi:hypothetical protein
LCCKPNLNILRLGFFPIEKINDQVLLEFHAKRMTIIRKDHHFH